MSTLHSMFIHQGGNTVERWDSKRSLQGEHPEAHKFYTLTFLSNIPWRMF